MQLGLGLPVRDVLDDAGAPLLRTALRKPNGFGNKNELAELTYEELCKIGAHKEDQHGNGQFRWLWRTSIKDYDRASQAVQKWSARVVQWTVDYRRTHKDHWIGGFAAYDRLSQGDPIAPKFDSFIEFAQLCDLLLSDLKAAAREDRYGATGSAWTVRCDKASDK